MDDKIKLNDELKYILYKPMRWRPTIVDKRLFIDDINKLKQTIISKIKSIITNKNDITIFIKTKCINSFKLFKDKLINELNKYIKQINYKSIKININKRQY